MFRTFYSHSRSCVTPVSLPRNQPINLPIHLRFEEKKWNDLRRSVGRLRTYNYLHLVAQGAYLLVEARPSQAALLIPCQDDHMLLVCLSSRDRPYLVPG